MLTWKRESGDMVSEWFKAAVFHDFYSGRVSARKMRFMVVKRMRKEYELSLSALGPRKVLGTYLTAKDAMRNAENFYVSIGAEPLPE